MNMLKLYDVILLYAPPVCATDKDIEYMGDILHYVGGMSWRYGNVEDTLENRALCYLAAAAFDDLSNDTKVNLLQMMDPFDGDPQ